MAPDKVEPQTIYLPPTPHVPNSHLPVLIYRNALTTPTPNDILSTIEPNHWLKGGQWSRSVATHFHATTHECYGITRGSSTYVLGKSPVDGDGYVACEIEVRHGDVFVLPVSQQALDCFTSGGATGGTDLNVELQAGVSHTSINHRDDYEFIGLYPEGGPITDGNPWDMNWADESPETTREIASRAARVPVPAWDPLYGVDGPLPRLWREAADRAARTAAAGDDNNQK